MDIAKTETMIIKRTHKKPYKVGKLFFGRVSRLKGAGWIVSASEDLSNPIKTFEAGKLARAYCEETRNDQLQQPWLKPSAQIGVNIPNDTGFVPWPKLKSDTCII
jgi:hypothetical protein